MMFKLLVAIIVVAIVTSNVIADTNDEKVDDVCLILFNNKVIVFSV